MGAAQEDGIGIRAGKMLYPLFVGQALAVLFTGLTFIIVARLLGPASYGVYTFAFGFSALINAFLAFGVGVYFTSTLSKLAYKKDGEGILRTLSSGYIIAGSVGLVLTLFGVGISGWVSGIYSNIGVSPLVLMLAAGTIIVGILNTLAVSALIGFSWSGLSSIVSVLVDVVQLVLSVVLTLKFGVMGAVAAIFIGYVFGAVLGGYFIYIAVSRYCKFRIYIPLVNELKEVFSVVWPLAATNFLNTSMQSFSILFLGLYVSTFVLGNYGAASKGLTLLSMIYGTFGSGLLPIFTNVRAMKAENEINSTYNKIIHFALIPMLPMIIYVAVMATPGLYLLVGGQYTTPPAYAPFYLALAAIGTTVGLFGGYVSYLLISGDHTKSVMVVNLISAIVQLAFMIILVPYIQVVGAIITIFFIGNIIEAIYFAKHANRKFGLKFELKKMTMLYASVAVFGLFLAGFYMLSNNLIQIANLQLKDVAVMAVGLVVAMLVYPIILILLRAVSEADMKDMRNATIRLGRVSSLFSLFFDYFEGVNKLLARF